MSALEVQPYCRLDGILLIEVRVSSVFVGFFFFLVTSLLKAYKFSLEIEMHIDTEV